MKTNQDLKKVKWLNEPQDSNKMSHTVFCFTWSKKNFSCSIVDVEYYISFIYVTVIHNFKGYIPVIATIKYCLYSLCCTIYPSSLFILHIVVCTY